MTLTDFNTHTGDNSSRDDHESVRTPPHDLLAEQSALGGMLLSKDAVADVVESVRGVDFYVPKHEIIFDAVQTLYAAGEPTDVIAVTDQLTKTGDLQRAGGAEYLHTLAGIVPTAANAGYYASIVAERAVLRRLVEAGTRIVQMGFGAEGEVVELVNQAQAEIYGVTGGVETEDYVPLSIALGDANTKSKPPKTAAANSPASPPDSATSTRSPTACTPASSSSSPPGPVWVNRPSRSTSPAQPQCTTSCQRSSSRSK